MPAKSKSQYRLFQAVANGKAQLPGMSKKEAKDFLENNQGVKSYERLPEKTKFKNLKKKLGR